MIKHLASAAGFAGIIIASLPASSANAASFTPFSFTNDVSTTPNTSANPNLLNDPTRDILLKSVTFGGNTYSTFNVVTGAQILQNDTYTLPSGETYGILNSGRGPNTSIDPLVGQGPSKPNPTASDVTASLGNLNLNSLLVTRESAPKASIEVSFADAIDTVFFWERGGTPGTDIYGDSDILVEALGDTNDVIASYHILRDSYSPAGYNISTLVNRPNPTDLPLLNNGPFNIGSLGLSLQGATTRTLRLTSTDNNRGPIGGTPPFFGDNGPDFKIIAARTQSVPGPLPFLGLAAAFGWSRKLRCRLPGSDG
jgi:hypothetical protein